MSCDIAGRWVNASISGGSKRTGDRLMIENRLYGPAIFVVGEMFPSDRFVQSRVGREKGSLELTISVGEKLVKRQSSRISK